MSDDPIAESENISDLPPSSSEDVSDGRAAYNLVSDTVTGVNIRWSDNKFQAVFIVISIIVLSVLGTILAMLFAGKDVPWFVGTLIGAFAGMVLGVFASGIYLMIYRALRHIRGKHD